MVIVKPVQLRTFSMPYPTETQQMEKVLVFNNIYKSIDDFLSEDEMDQDPSWGEQHNSMEDINQSLDDSVIILDVELSKILPNANSWNCIIEVAALGSLCKEITPEELPEVLFQTYIYRLVNKLVAKMLPWSQKEVHIRGLGLPPWPQADTQAA